MAHFYVGLDIHWKHTTAPDAEGRTTGRNRADRKRQTPKELSRDHCRS